MTRWRIRPRDIDRDRELARVAGTSEIAAAGFDRTHISIGQIGTSGRTLTQQSWSRERRNR